ncbi:MULTISPECIES: ABC transporter permease [Stappiaceae]|jgi:simple sugar transport system permease protein|uniref:ABC transporter permease n=1 Tax=Stappiaceae TaxID=2821832 RepID=UPI000782047F|nr:MULTISPECIES: ABC transporter permease [Stappiaceae]MCR9281017.1 ABC transporter permease [Paracoccaceae bacterium]MEC9401206.1 ABC transporter permease [Pseudomonadota bacterium]AMN52288.1 ABC transporter permease [Labrenzia sp. CP4]MBN8181614.1 ABC transporter permease [Roseibium aggregatum]MBO9460080.1 ABC transporter permease [Labrenzia sp. R5_0]
MIRFEPRGPSSVSRMLGVSIAAAVAALVLAAIPMAFAGLSVFEAYSLMAKGAFGSLFAFTEMLTRATPLILTGLAAAVAFRAKLWNIGAEGQLYAGALAAVAVGTGVISAPPYLLIPMVIVAGALAGGLVMLGPTLLKTRLGVDEVVTTLLLNFIILLFVQMMLEGPMKDPMGMGWPQSEPILDEAALPKLMDRMRIHWGLVIALVSSLGVYFLLKRTVWGFEIRAVGENAAAARHAGIPVTATFIRVGLLSGALAGLAGVGEVAGLKGYLTADLSPGFGYSGIVVAMLAGLSPAGVVLAALFIASIFVGADSMSRATGVSNYLADLIVAMALLCVLVSGLFLRFKIRFVGSQANPEAAE